MISVDEAHRTPAAAPRSLAALLCFLVLAACEKAFEPIAPSELVFSIYGHLDAAVDTQWVRVMPIRQSVETPAGPIDAVVTLEEIETGVKVIMTDSLSRYQPLFLGEADIYAHNFWTTLPVVPGRNYRLTVTRSDGAMATASVLVPTFVDPTLEIRYRFRFPVFPNHPELIVDATVGTAPHPIAMALSREAIPPSCQLPAGFHQEPLPTARPGSRPGEHELGLTWINAPPQFVPSRPPCHLEPKRILVIASGSPWLFDPGTPLRELSHLAGVDNIDGRGLGFLGGVHTQTFPYPQCIPFERNGLCTLTMSPRSGTLVGLVQSECIGGPQTGAVEAKLLGPFNGTRYDTTDVNRIVRFEGVDPGVAHVLTLRQLAEPPKFYPDTVTNIIVGEAAVDTVSSVMRHMRNCLP